MRLEDFRYYSRILRWVGIVFIIIGIVLPIITAYEQSYPFDLFPPEWRFPYLMHGIILFSGGVGLILVSVILSREYRIRKSEQDSQLQGYSDSWIPRFDLISKKSCEQKCFLIDQSFNCSSFYNKKKDCQFSYPCLGQSMKATKANAALSCCGDTSQPRLKRYSEISSLVIRF